MIGDQIDETWDFIDDWPNYLISNYGRVYNIEKERLLKIESSEKWYSRVRLARDGEYFVAYVHRLVGLGFVEGWFEGAVINHKDGNFKNNYFRNLEWCTQKQNIQHAFATGLATGEHSRNSTGGGLGKGSRGPRGPYKKKKQ